MNFKRISVMLICLMILFIFVSCGSGDNTQPTVAPENVNGEDPDIELNPEDFKDADIVLAGANNVDITNYTLLKWGFLKNCYWNCTKKAETTTPFASAGTYQQNICSEEKYSIEDLPVGTVFIVDEGWQYRIDIFPDSEGVYTGGTIIIISNEKYRAFALLLIRMFTKLQGPASSTVRDT